MARKKSSAAPATATATAPARAPVEEDDTIKPLRSPRDLSPDNKLDNLKTLNQLLLKETMEKRFQIDRLKAQIDEVTDTSPFVADIEREVSRIVVAAAIADEALKVGSLQERLGLARGERDEMRRGMESVAMERDEVKKEVELRRKEVGELEARVRDLEMGNVEIRERLEKVAVERDEIERLGMKKEEAFESLREMMEDVEKEKAEMSRKHKKELKAMVAETVEAVKKARVLEEEGQVVAENKRRLEEEIRVLREEFDSMIREGEELRLQAFELADKNGEAQEEIDRLRGNVAVLEEKNREGEREYESKNRELELELGELRKKAGEILREKDEVEKVRSECEAEILELRNEVEKLCLNVAGLEEKCRDSGEKNAQLVGENDAVKKELAVLGKEMAEKEKGFEVKVGELMANLDDLSVKMREIAAEKEEVETVRAKQDVEIVGLKKEGEKLISNVAELEEMCRNYSEKSAKLQDESDAVKRELVVRKEESSRLQSQVEELEKEKVEMEKGFEAKVSELMVKLENLSAKLGEIIANKAEVEIVRAKQDMEIVGLKKEVEKLISNISELEGRSTQLQHERDAVERELGVQRDESCRLQSLVDELEKSKAEGLKELKQQLTASLNALMAEKEEGKRQIESLTEKKASLEKSLLKANEEADLMVKRMRAAEMIRDKALSLLKSTRESMHGTEMAQDNGAIYDNDDEIRPFAEELHSIKGAFRSRAAKIEEMNQEMEVLKTAVEDEKKKKKPGLMMWLYPATTTVLAAISFAYAARGR